MLLLIQHKYEYVARNINYSLICNICFYYSNIKKKRRRRSYFIMIYHSIKLICFTCNLTSRRNNNQKFIMFPFCLLILLTPGWGGGKCLLSRRSIACWVEGEYLPSHY